MEKKDRSYCFTLFVEESAKLAAQAFVLTPKIRYLVWQLELCPKTKREHYQGYAELLSPMRLKAFKNELGYNKVHIEGRQGTRDEARNYCMKTDTRLKGPFELGEWKAGGQGKRKDMDEAARIIKKDGLDAVADAMPGTFIRCQKHFRDYQTYLDNRDQPISRDILCFWLHGPTNIGKSHCIYTTVPNLYALCPGTGQNWYDGYNKEQGLLIDDIMADTIPPSDMLHIADKWRYRCPIKGGFTWARWNLLVVTSNHSIHFTYQGTSNIESIIRRFKILKVETREECTEASEYIKTCVGEGVIPEKDWIPKCRPEKEKRDVGRSVVGNTSYDFVPADCPSPLPYAWLEKFN